MATGEAKWQDTLEGFTKDSFEADGKRRDIFRVGSGPTVIVISEIPGITPQVATFGRRVAAAGCTAVLPHLFGEPGRPPSMGYMMESIGPACVSHEFAWFALKKTSPVTVWLRKLAKAEHERNGGPGVGVIGMCFTGGFALAMMVDDIVLAPVLSQPSLPFPALQEAQGGHRDLRQRPGQGQGAHRSRHRASSGCASATTRSVSPSASRRCAASSATSSSPWSSTPPPAILYGHPKQAHSVVDAST